MEGTTSKGHAIEATHEHGAAADEHTVSVAVPRSVGAYLLEARDAGAVLRVGDSIVVGSALGSGLRLAERTVSASHCRFANEGGRLVVEDLASTNGVLVGGARVARATVDDATTVVLGRAVVACTPFDESASADCGADARLPGVVGGSQAMRVVGRAVRKVAGLRASVLIRGETGAGKDVLARALHAVGPRATKPFVALNVATLPRDLAESELFGFERGAFTGAHAARPGAFVEANGGTLFLDEIGELPLDVQAKLLRVLEDGEVRPLGGRGRRVVDVRVVSATWASLEQRVAEGRFRADLYQRLAVFVVDVPPLRERRSDVAALTDAMLDKLRDEVGPRVLTPGALARLAAHDWPGNVRELKNVVYRAAVRAEGPAIGTADVEAAIAVSAQPARVALSSARAQAALAANAGNVSATARALGVPRTTLRDRLRGEKLRDDAER